LLVFKVDRLRIRKRKQFDYIKPTCSRNTK